MVTLVSIVIAIKYLLCNTLPEEPLVFPEKVSSVEAESCSYDPASSELAELAYSEPLSLVDPNHTCCEAGESDVTMQKVGL
jgi:hypothetical protein